MFVGQSYPAQYDERARGRELSSVDVVMSNSAGCAMRVVLLALLAASASAQKRAPSASKIAATKMWLRRPGDGMRVELISKSRLPQVCKEHDLDLEAMLAVASGDADDCEGWTCGEASDYGGEAAGAAADEPAAEAKLPTPAQGAAAKAKAAKAAAASDDDDDGPVKLAPKDVKGAAAPPTRPRRWAR